MAGCRGIGSGDVDSTTPVRVEEEEVPPEPGDSSGPGNPPDPGDTGGPGDDEEPGGTGEPPPSGEDDGEVDSSAAPRCAELSEQGLLCHDGWCWELQGQQGNDLLATSSTGTEVWAVGAAGTVLHWDGKRWSREASGTLMTLTDVDAAEGEVWAVGAEGTILRRTKGHWHAEASPSPVDVHQVEVPAPGEAWIAVAGGVARYRNGAWTWVLSTEGRYDLWSTGPEDVWILGDAVAHHWDGTALRKLESPFIGGRLGGSEPGRPFVAAANTVYQWNGEAFEERFAISNDTFSIDFLAQRGGDLWVYASRGGLGGGLDDGRLLLRWDGTTAHVAWSETFPTFSNWASGLPRSLALLDGGGAFLVGERGRTLRWDGASWSEPPRIPGDIEELLPFHNGEFWALHWNRSSYLSGLHWDGTDWRRLQVGGFSSGRFTGTAPDDVWMLLRGLHRWDGSTWHGYDAAELAEILSVKRDDVWAVGAGGRAVHWQGAGWTEVDTGTTGDLRSLWASGTNDVWAGGASLVHWDGEAWAPAPGLDPAEDLRISHLSGSGSDDVWALGARLHHWDGTAWRDVALPEGNAHCWNVWSAGPNATHATCDEGFFIRDERGWRALPFQYRASAFAGTKERGYAVSGDALLRYCRQ